jgi:hypothetical protein
LRGLPKMNGVSIVTPTTRSRTLVINLFELFLDTRARVPPGLTRRDWRERHKSQESSGVKACHNQDSLSDYI